MPNTQNILTLIRNKLLGVASVTDEVEDRVHTSHFYDLDNASIVYPMIILNPVGGFSSYSKSWAKTELHIYVYSQYNLDQCLRIYQLVYNSLQAEGLSNTNISDKGYLRETARPTNGYNDQTRSYYLRATYQIYTAG